MSSTAGGAANDAAVTTDGAPDPDDGSKAAIKAATEKVKRQKAHLAAAEKHLAALRKGN